MKIQTQRLSVRRQVPNEVKGHLVDEPLDAVSQDFDMSVEHQGIGDVIQLLCVPCDLSGPVFCSHLRASPFEGQVTDVLSEVLNRRAR